jgi:3-methyladenine DNA glycosylase AlkD
MKSGSKKRGITPKGFAREATRLLRKHRDPAHAEGVGRYFKEAIHAYGVRTPILMKIEKDLYRRTEGKWTAAEAVELCEILLPKKYIEEKGLPLVTLQRFAEQLEPGFVRTAEKWLASNYVDSWATVDTLAPYTLGSVIDRHPEVIPRIMKWTASRNRWLRRAAAVSFVVLARRGKCLDSAYEIAERLLHDKKDDLVHKANGWMLREAGDSDMKRLERFLLKHGPAIPRTTLRYAIEHFPEKKRKSLLIKTKH